MKNYRIGGNDVVYVDVCPIGTLEHKPDGWYFSRNWETHYAANTREKAADVLFRFVEHGVLVERR
jgi:NADH dehydrogenase/NADH:ubiquinone oxidoreductase subunit G